LPFGVHHRRSCPCLSALAAFTALAKEETEPSKELSPFAFGVHHVHHKMTEEHFFKARKLSPLPFGVHRVHHRTTAAILTTCDGIASPLPFGVHRVHHSLPLKRRRMRASIGLHCLSAFTAFTTAAWCDDLGADRQDLHCLSAFTAFTTNRYGQYRRTRAIPSPLPFGVHRVHHTV